MAMSPLPTLQRDTASGSPRLMCSRPTCWAAPFSSTSLTCCINGIDGAQRSRHCTSLSHPRPTATPRDASTPLETRPRPRAVMTGLGLGLGAPIGLCAGTARGDGRGATCGTMRIAMLDGRVGRILTPGERAGRYLGLERMRMGQVERAIWSEAKGQGREGGWDHTYRMQRLSRDTSV